MKWVCHGLGCICTQCDNDDDDDDDDDYDDDDDDDDLSSSHVGINCERIGAVKRFKGPHLFQEW